MSRTVMKPGCMLAPLPAALVSCGDKDGNTNLITVAWTGIANSEPPMAYVSIRPERFSHHMILETGEFVINLTTVKMAEGTDLCGVRSGRDTDKWKAAGFTKGKASVLSCPVVEESPVSIECRVKQVLSLGSHDMFLAEIVAVDADDSYFDEKGRFDLNAAGLVSYIHGAYVKPGKPVGTFGFSVKKKPSAGKTVRKAGKPESAGEKPGNGETGKPARSTGKKKKPVHPEVRKKTYGKQSGTV